MNKKILFKSLLGIAGITAVPTIIATTATSCNSPTNETNNSETSDFVFKTDNVKIENKKYNPNSTIREKISENVFNDIHKNVSYFLQTLAYWLESIFNLKDIQFKYSTELNENYIVFNINGSFKLLEKTNYFEGPIKYIFEKGVNLSSNFKNDYCFSLDDWKLNGKSFDDLSKKKFACTLKEMQQVFGTLLATKFINITSNVWSPDKDILDIYNDRKQESIKNKTFINFFKLFVIESSGSEKPIFNKKWEKKSYFTNVDVSLKDTILTFNSYNEISTPLNSNSKVQKYKVKIDINLVKGSNNKYTFKQTVTDNNGNIISKESKTKELAQEEFDKLMSTISDN